MSSAPLLKVITSTVALVNFSLLAIFMRRRLGRLEGHRLGSTVLRICLASLPMAGVAWSVSAFSMALPLHGLALHLFRVVASITLAGVIFYLACRMLHIEELDEAIEATAGKLLRVLRRK